MNIVPGGKKGRGLSASSAGLKRSQWSDLRALAVWRSDTGEKVIPGSSDQAAGFYK